MLNDGHIPVKPRPVVAPARIRDHWSRLYIGIVGLLSIIIPVAANAQTPPTRIAVVNLALVYDNLQETIDSQHDIERMQGRLTELNKTHQTDLHDRQTEIAKSTGAPHQQMLEDFDQTSAEYQAQEATKKIEIARFQNRRLAREFDEMRETLTQLAKSGTIDLVLVELGSHKQETDADKLANQFFNRNIAFKTGEIDLTQTVIAQLNKNYKPAATQHSPADLPMASMQIGSKTYHLEIAGDDASREHGLMERDSMPADHGMIFVFAAASNQAFWMHHTRFDLDIVFVGDGGKVVSVHSMKAYDESNTYSDGPAKYAIELSAGQAAASGVKAGDMLHIPAEVDAALKK